MSDDAGKVMQAWMEAIRACSFCGNDGRDGSTIFCASRAAICEDCTAVIYEKIAQHYPQKLTNKPMRH